MKQNLTLIMTCLLACSIHAAQQHSFLAWEPGCFDEVEEKQKSNSPINLVPRLQTLALAILEKKYWSIDTKNVLDAYVQENSADFEELLHLDETSQRHLARNILLNSSVLMKFFVQKNFITFGKSDQRARYDHESSDSPDGKLTIKERFGPLAIKTTDKTQDNKIIFTIPSLSDLVFARFCWAPNSEICAFYTNPNVDVHLLEIWNVIKNSKLFRFELPKMLNYHNGFGDYWGPRYILRWSPNSKMLAILRNIWVVNRKRSLYDNLYSTEGITAEETTDVDTELYIFDIVEGLIFHNPKFRITTKQVPDLENGEQYLWNMCPTQNELAINFIIPAEFLNLTIEQLMIVGKIIKNESFSKLNSNEQTVYQTLPRVWQELLEKAYKSSWGCVIS